MQVFTEKDLSSKKPQFLQLNSGGCPYDIQPMHVNIDEYHQRKSDGRAHGHQHDVYHVVLYGKSSGDFSVCGKDIPAKPGTLALTSPGEEHMFQPMERGAVSYSEFTFSYAAVRGGRYLRIPFRDLLSLHSGLEISEMGNIQHLEQEKYDELRGILLRINELKESTSKLRFIQFYRNIADLFNFLSVLCISKDVIPEDSLSAGLARARDHIHSNYQRAIMIGNLAKIACVSKGHFQREFKRRFGFAPAAYINSYRVGVAKNLLRTTPMQCAEIAEKTGFEDIFYFSKVFKKFAGTSPAAYRKGRL